MEGYPQRTSKKTDCIHHLCDFCSYSTNKPSNLKRHMLVHTGERPFVCSICSYRCNQKENLKKHMLKHSC